MATSTELSTPELFSDQSGNNDNSELLQILLLQFKTRFMDVSSRLVSLNKAHTYLLDEAPEKAMDVRFGEVQVQVKIENNQFVVINAEYLQQSGIVVLNLPGGNLAIFQKVANGFNLIGMINL